MTTLQAELNRLAGTTGLAEQGAANAWAGTTGLSLVGALNVKAGTTGLALQGVLNQLAGTTGLGPAAAAAVVSGVLAADTFDRADSATGLDTSSAGQPWTMHASVWGISSNRAYTASGAGAVASVATSTSNQDVRVTLTTLGTASQYIGVVARMADISNHYWADCDTAGFRLFKRVANVATSVATTTAFVPAAGDVLRLVVTGSTQQVYRNSTLVLSASDTALATGVRAGLRNAIPSTTARFDNFEVRSA